MRHRSRRRAGTNILDSFTCRGARVDMGRYDELSRILSSAPLASRRTPVPESEINSLKTKYPRIPEDYLDYLREVGWGDFGDGTYMIYSGPLSSDEIYDPETAADLSHILFFGDNFGGDCAGFDTENDWAVVEVDHTDMSSSEESQTFEEFIQDRVRARYGAL